MFNITSKNVNLFQKSKLFELFLSLVDITRPVFEIIVMHGTMVANKALGGAAKVKELNPDLQFIYEAGVMHDIGIIFTHAPDIDCFGKAPYIQHGILGAEFLRSHGLEKFARVCERHVGTGITTQDIEKQNLKLPKKDLIPETIEEQLICWADKFFSKNENVFYKQKSVEEVLRELSAIDPSKSQKFLEWNQLFGEANG